MNMEILYLILPMGHPRYTTPEAEEDILNETPGIST
jgi:hypothetical protein